MDGCYRRLFTIEDMVAVMERIREALRMTNTQAVCSLLGFESFDALKKQAGKPGPGMFLNGVFDLCARYRLNREYILLGHRTGIASDYK